MKIWAIGDLHFPSIRNKPMDIFGPAWQGHIQKIKAAWGAAVAEEDTVLVPGDLSWAMRLHQMEEEFSELARLPGRHKILVRGNHDYWWSSRRKMERFASPQIHFLHNSAVCLPPFVFAGTRGWDLPSPECTEEENAERERLCSREAERLKRSLEQARSCDAGRLIVMMHFPPLFRDNRTTVFTDILDEVSPEAVVYGHLHGDGIQYGFEGASGNTRYLLTSADAVEFAPVVVAEAHEA